MAVVEHDLSYNFEEYKWIRKLHLTLNPEVKYYCRNTIVIDVDVTRIYNV